MARLPIDYAGQLETIKALPGSWYAAQEIPPKLIRKLQHSPLLEEWEIDRHVLAPTSLLSDAVLAVLECAAAGMGEKETATKLVKSIETIKKQRRQALAVLHCRNITQAVAVAIRMGALLPG